MEWVWDGVFAEGIVRFVSDRLDTSHSNLCRCFGGWAGSLDVECWTEIDIRLDKVEWDMY